MWTWNDILQWGAMAPKDLPIGKGESLSHDNIMELWENEQYNLEPGQPNMYDALKQRATSEKEADLYGESYEDNEIGETVVPEEDYGGESAATYDDLYPVSEASDEDFYQDTPATDEDLGIIGETLALEQQELGGYPDSTTVTNEDLRQADIAKNIRLEEESRRQQEIARGDYDDTEVTKEDLYPVTDATEEDLYPVTDATDEDLYGGETLATDEDAYLTDDEYYGTTSLEDEEYLTEDDDSPVAINWAEKGGEGLVYDDEEEYMTQSQREPQSLLQRVLGRVGKNLSYGGQAMLMNSPEYMYDTGGDKEPLNFDYSGYLDWMKGLK